MIRDIKIKTQKPKDSIKKNLLVLINKDNKGFKINIQKLVAYLHKNKVAENSRKQSHLK